MKERALVCPVCGSVEWRIVYKIKEWDINECLSCHFARIIPIPEPAKRQELYSEEAVVGRNTKKLTLSRRFFRALKHASNRILKRDKGGIFYDKLCRRIARGSKVLDVGCGSGSFLLLSQQRFTCAGIEISEYLAGVAMKNSGLKIITGDFHATDFGTEKYDAITLISLLEHFVDPSGVIRKCYSLLNDKGVLLIKTVNYDCMNRKIKMAGWTGFRPPDHVVYFSPVNLKALLMNAGFSKTKILAYPFSDNMYCDAVK